MFGHWSTVVAALALAGLLAFPGLRAGGIESIAAKHGMTVDPDGAPGTSSGGQTGPASGPTAAGDEGMTVDPDGAPRP